MTGLLLRALLALAVLVHAALASGQQPIAPLLPPPMLVIGAPAEQPVRLQAVRIDSEVSGGQALTSVEMVFHNPNARVLEGELQFPLLDGQQVVGFALDIDGRLRDAVAVEKARGQEVFEEVTRQRVDPALLSQTAGNNYKLRVYPLPAHGTRRVVVRYSETLSARGGQRLYRLPLAYATSLDVLELRLTVRSPGDAPVARGPLGQIPLVRVGVDFAAAIERRQFSATGWLELAVPAPTRAEVRTQTVGGRHYFLAEVPAGRAALGTPRTLPRVVGIVWDSSGSGAAREHARELELLDAYFKQLGDGEVRLIRVRDRSEPVQRFTVQRGDWRALRKALEATAYDGATQLGAFAPEEGVGEYLVFSDGLENYGDAPFPDVRVPVHAVSAALAGNATRLRRLAQASGGRFVDLLAQPPAEAKRLLLHTTTMLQELSGTGVSSLVAASSLPVDGRWRVAGVLEQAQAQVRLSVERNGRTETLAIPVRREQAADGLAAATWARLKVAELEGEPRLHRNQIREIGEGFRLVTSRTSLIVLDRVEDYARHGIEPPTELKAEVDRLRSALARSARDEQQKQLARIVARFEERKAWWAKDFPRVPRPAPVATERPRRETGAAAGGAIAGSAPPPPAAAPTRPPAAEAATSPGAPAPQRALAAKSAAQDKAAGGERMVIRLQPARPDAPYVSRLRNADSTELYAAYLDERRSNERSTAFFLDAADLYFERGERELGLRALSNLAEMDLENRAILRILGYRLMQAGAPRLAIPVLQRVLDIAPNEPQSWRDLGLAYQAAGEWQKAFDALVEVVIRPWHNRFPDIELTALAEVNALVAVAPVALDAHRLDPRLATNLPLDLRVVLTWDADNTDIDLWVTDPNGEKSFYGNRLSYQGGRMSADFTGGYGPEEYALKAAKPGKYKVEANFYGHRQQTVAGATTLQVKLTTAFGTSQAQEKIITLRLKGRSEVVQVGEFEVT